MSADYLELVMYTWSRRYPSTGLVAKTKKVGRQTIFLSADVFIGQNNVLVAWLSR